MTETELAFLKSFCDERVRWLDREIEAGGDYPHLVARRDECAYVCRTLDAYFRAPALPPIMPVASTK